MEEIDREEDRALFDRWVKGDTVGFSSLYGKYKQRVFGFLLKMIGDREIAEDLLQETFLAALRNREQYDRDRNFLSWVFGIAHKRTIDFFRHARVEREYSDIAEERSTGSKIEAPDASVESKTLRLEIQGAVQKLEPLQREVFLLRELGGVPFKDISEIMNCSINTALGRMRLALINIRKELQQRGIDGM